MPYKPVGVDENSQFPPRVRQALADMFVTKPVDISDGQVPVWNAATNTWIAGSGGGSSDEWVLPTAIDGGVWDPATSTWVHETGPQDSPPEVDGGTPASSN